MRLLRRSPLLPCLGLALAGCGGSPTGPTAAPTPAVPTYPLSVLVFYDENGNGVLDPSESVRVPGVSVTAAGHGATTAAGGVASLQLPEGSQQVSVTTSSLPPYWEAKTVVTVDVPKISQALVPLTLPIGSANQPNLYMGFGDSITVGDGSTNSEGYLGPLQALLGAHFGRCDIYNDGIDATRSNRGADRIAGDLGRVHPATVLIHYGTNDWNEQACRDAPPCYTIDSLRTIVRASKAAGSLPYIATILPVNVGYDARVPPERQDWVHRMDALIRDMASQEGAPVVDLEKEFLKVPDLSTIFFDHVHPNDAGYKIVANTFYNAITQPRASSAGAGQTAASLGPWPKYPHEIPPDPADQGPRRP